MWNVHGRNIKDSDGQTLEPFLVDCTRTEHYILCICTLIELCIYSLYRDRTLELGTDSETVRLTNGRIQIYKCTNGMYIGRNLHLHYYE